MNLSERTHPVLAIAPATNGSKLEGDFINMKYTGHITVAVALTQGHATSPVISLHQATSVSGSNVKALGKEVNIAYVADAATSDEMVEQTPAVNFTPDTALKNKVVLFEVPVEALDVNNGFSCLQVQVAASNAANVVSVTCWCSEERYHGKSKIA